MVAILRSAALLLGALVPFGAAAGTYTARVVGITEGDTLRAVHEGREIIVRLRWIDAPEKGQPFGDRAARALGELATGRVVTVRDFGADRSGRRVAEVVLPDGRNLNRELVRLGWAWWARKSSADVTLGTLEANARAAGRGLWAAARPIPPWEWRSAKAPSP
jgi:endonuclease YncB( thermonuclease family)